MLKHLKTPVQVRKLGSKRDFKGVLQGLYEQLADQGIEFPLMIDENEFTIQNPTFEIYAAPIDLSLLPEVMTVSEFMRGLLDQLSNVQGNVQCDVLVRKGYLEITTKHALGKRGYAGVSKWNLIDWITGRDDPDAIPLAELEESSRSWWLGAGAACGIVMIAFLVWRWKRTGRAGHRQIGSDVDTAVC